MTLFICRISPDYHQQFVMLSVLRNDSELQRIYNYCSLSHNQSQTWFITENAPSIMSVCTPVLLGIDFDSTAINARV